MEKQAISVPPIAKISTLLLRRHNSEFSCKQLRSGSLGSVLAVFSESKPFHRSSLALYGRVSSMLHDLEHTYKIRNS